MGTEIATLNSAYTGMQPCTEDGTAVGQHDFAGASACRQSIWKRHFTEPQGVPGALAGRLMAAKNGAMNGFAFEMLDVWPHERVLELGFGPGRLLGWLTARAVEGLVVGVDPSQTMVDSARRRFRGHIQAGRVEICRACASSLPFEEGRFDKACAVNSFQFWSDPEQDLAEVKRVLRPGGVLLLCLRTEDADRPTAAPTFTLDDLGLVEQLARKAGFVDVRRYEQKARQTVTCVLANR